MPQGEQVISAFTSGEMSPRLYGRTDLKKYQHGMKEVRNFLVQKHGATGWRIESKREYILALVETVDEGAGVEIGDGPEAKSFHA